MIDKLDGQSMDLVKENVEKLKELFPSIVKEDKIDFEELELLLGENINRNKEQYSFTWNGKTEATKLAQKRSTGTLRPCIEESKDWDTTQNLYIEGDNLEVLRLLQASYNGKIKMIYIDPPYNTGHDFVYKDNFEDNIKNYKEQTGQAAKSNADTDGRYHTNWLNMMYPRLKLARTLLKDDGVIFISIDDNEQANLKKICDDVFGENNFVAIFPWQKRTAKSDVPFGVSQVFEYILCYTKSNLFLAGERHSRKYYKTSDYISRWRTSDLKKQTTAEERPNSYFTMVNPKNGKEYPANKNRTWMITKDTFQDYYDRGKIIFPGDYEFLNISEPVYRVFEDEDIKKSLAKYGIENFKSVSTYLEPKIVGMSETGTKDFNFLFNNKSFAFPKPVSLIKRLINISTTNNDYILDFFSGSATTAHAVMQLNAEDGGNRKFIMVQLPELTDENSEAYKAGYKNICEIGKERIRRAGEKIKQENPDKQLDIGFKVFKLDSSNLIKWDNTPTKDVDTIKDRIQSSIDYLKDDRTELDLVYEVMLKYGIDLSYPIKQTENKKAYIVEAPEYKLLVCTQPNLTIEDIESFANESVGTYLFADRCFNTDNLLINTEEILKSRNKEMRLF